jgi:hypothetical protein
MTIPDWLIAERALAKLPATMRQSAAPSIFATTAHLERIAMAKSSRDATAIHPFQESRNIASMGAIWKTSRLFVRRHPTWCCLPLVWVARLCSHCLRCIQPSIEHSRSLQPEKICDLSHPASEDRLESSRVE